MNKAQIDCLQGIVFCQKQNMLIRTPDGLPKVALRLLYVLAELFLLSLIKLDVVRFIADRLPREKLPRLFSHRLGGFSDYPNDSVLKRPRTCATLPHGLLDEIACGFLLFHRPIQTANDKRHDWPI